MKLAIFKNGTTEVLVQSAKLIEMILAAQSSGQSLAYDVVDVAREITMAVNSPDLKTKIIEAIRKRKKNTVTQRILVNFVREFKRQSKLDQASILQELIEEKKIHPTQGKQTIFYNIYVEGQNQDKVSDEFDWLVNMKLDELKFIAFEKMQSNYYRKLLAKARMYGIKLKCSDSTGGMYVRRVA